MACMMLRGMGFKKGILIVGNKVALWVLILGFGAVGLVATLASLNAQSFTQIV